MRHYYEQDGIVIYHGDCREILPNIKADAVVTDPPYGLAFMGKRWDYDVPSVEIWAECLRVLKPGGHLLAFAGTRTQHRMAVRIEDAGFEIRDMIAWVYGSGFPKSLDVSKAIDKAAGKLDDQSHGFNSAGGKDKFQAQDKSFRSDYGYAYSPATPEAQQWQGWGTALKPALEPITVARKPLEGTVAENVLKHGVGGINVDGCRVGTDGGGGNGLGSHFDRLGNTKPLVRHGEASGPIGRWPANLIHDGSDEVADLLGSAARFFYCPKASKADRSEGNIHPTVKPTDLMRYLCRLVTPPGGIVLDPFMGSGTTLVAAKLEGRKAIGIELEEEYCEIAAKRLAQGMLSF